MLADRARIGREKGKNEYVLATDDDFSGTADGQFRYIGTDKYVEMPHVIKGVNVTRYDSMFRNTSVKGVLSTNKNITSMGLAFWSSRATSLDLSHFDTSSTENMASMFYESKATSLDLSNFNTSNVTTMGNMFNNSQATSIDVSSFDLSSVTNMYAMFQKSQATSLDLSSFDTSNEPDMRNMFSGLKATIGYARTQADADRFNASRNKPIGLNFVVKP